MLIPLLNGDHVDGTDMNPRHLAVEVMLLCALNDASHLRRFLAESKGRVLSSLIYAMLSEEDQGVQGQISEILKAVMDPSPLEHRDRDSYLDLLHQGLDELIVPLRETPAETPSRMFAQQLVCELLAFIVVHHGYRARIFVIRFGIAQQAARLLSAPQRFLQLAPVRLLRAIVGTKDDAYHRYLTKNGLFALLMKNFQLSLQPPALGGNLFISATLDLLEFIRIENIKVLVDHLCKKHANVLHLYARRFRPLLCVEVVSSVCAYPSLHLITKAVIRFCASCRLLSFPVFASLAHALVSSVRLVREFLASACLLLPLVLQSVHSDLLNAETSTNTTARPSVLAPKQTQKWKYLIIFLVESWLARTRSEVRKDPKTGIPLLGTLSRRGMVLGRQRRTA